MVAVGDILQSGIIKLGILPPVFTRELCMILFASFVMFPLSLFERINSLRFSSLFGILSIFFLVFSATFHSVNDIVNNPSWEPEIKFIGGFTDVVKATPIIMFAFTCQVNVFSIYEELSEASPSRMNRVSIGATGTCLLAYALMGVFGYLDFGSSTNANILLNYCVERTRDPMMITAYACIVITIVMAFPLNIFPCRYTVEVVLSRWLGYDASNDKDIESQAQAESDRLLESMNSVDTSVSFSEPKTGAQKARHFTLTAVLVGSSLFVALKVPNISTVFSLLGSTTSSFVCFVLPAAFALKIGFTKKRPGLHIATWCLAIGGAAVGFLSTGVTIYGMVYPDPIVEINCS